MRILAFVADWSLAIYQDRFLFLVGFLVASGFLLFMAVFA